MTHHEHEHGGKHDHGHSQGHGHEHHQRYKPIHHRWYTWVAVLLMLAAMIFYVMSDDERFAPGNEKHEPMPAAPAM